MPCHILLVEDDPNDALLTRRLLARAGLAEHLDVASSYEDAVTALATGAYDVALIDFFLGPRSGLEVLDAASAMGCATPLIVLTGARDPAVDQAVLEHGAVDFLVKDTSNSEPLERAIRYAVQRGRVLRELRSSEEHFRAIAENGPGVVYLRSSDGTRPPIYVSPAIERLAGVRAEDLVSGEVPFDDLCWPEDRERLRATRASLTTRGDRFTVEYRLGTGKQERWIEERGCALSTEPSGLTPIAGVLFDVTERRQAQVARDQIRKRLERTQYLESLGVLAGGVAHDFNNFLAEIQAGVQLALRDLEPEHPAQTSIESLVAPIHRAAALTRQILAYAGKAGRLSGIVDLSSWVRELSGLLRASVSHAITLDLDLGADLPPVDVDVGQLLTLVLNLITNASEAIGEHSGSIRIQTSRERVVPERLGGLVLGGEPEAREYVALEVHDTGTGMDEATIERAFEPFFTTKLTGRGLGLAVALGNVRSNGGFLRVVSEPGQGSTFTVYLPAADGSRSARAGSSSAQPPSRHGHLR